MAVLTINQMTRAQKLQAMEELWESLSGDEERLNSPTWHGDALEETRQNYAAGSEQPVEWEAAKRELRKPSE